MLNSQERNGGGAALAPSVFPWADRKMGKKWRINFTQVGGYTSERLSCTDVKLKGKESFPPILIFLVRRWACMVIVSSGRRQVFFCAPLTDSITPRVPLTLSPSPHLSLSGPSYPIAFPFPSLRSETGVSEGWETEKKVAVNGICLLFLCYPEHECARTAHSRSITELPQRHVTCVHTLTAKNTSVQQSNTFLFPVL